MRTKVLGWEIGCVCKGLEGWREGGSAFEHAQSGQGLTYGRLGGICRCILRAKDICLSVQHRSYMIRFGFIFVF